MRRSDREISDIQEIESIIEKADVCHIAIANDNTPYLVTMNFGYVAGPVRILYFHCAREGRKLEMIRKNNFVCFEMDTDHNLAKGTENCGWGMTYSSVLGHGVITIINDVQEKITGLNSIMRHYGGDQPDIYDENVLEQTTILRLEIKEMTGKSKK